MYKPALTSLPIHPLLAQRWSPRAFDPDFVVSPQAKIKLLEAARWAPSCFGAEPWVVICCDRHENSDDWHNALGCLVPNNQRWAKGASLLFLACAQTHFAHNNNENRHHAYDTGAAIFSLVLQTEALGLRAHQMGGFVQQKVREVFTVPAEFICMSMIAVGRQIDAADLSDPGARERETALRLRKPLSENFFAGSWGNPAVDESAVTASAPRSSYEDLRKYIRDIPDFPKPGILFRDITPLLANPLAYQRTLHGMLRMVPGGVQAVSAVEARGFLFGIALAQMMGVPFIPIRKAGKLPAETLSVKCQLEYGQAELQIHKDAIPIRDTRVLLVDDLLSTGGTLSAATELLEGVGGQIAHIACAIELQALGGRMRLSNYSLDTLLLYR